MPLRNLEHRPTDDLLTVGVAVLLLLLPLLVLLRQVLLLLLAVAHLLWRVLPFINCGDVLLLTSYRGGGSTDIPVQHLGIVDARRWQLVCWAARSSTYLWLHRREILT